MPLKEEEKAKKAKDLKKLYEKKAKPERKRGKEKIMKRKILYQHVTTENERRN